MTITTRTELKTEIEAWSKRDDLTDKLDDFITLAEQVILRQLKLRTNEVSATGTATDTIAFPAALGTIVRLEVVIDSTRFALDYAAPGIEYTAAGYPNAFTVQDDAIRLIPSPSGTFTYTLHYIPNLTPLSDANPTNWALTNAPDVYLWGALMQLALYTLDDASAEKWRIAFTSAMDLVKRVDEAKRLPISGGLQIKPRSAR